MKDDVKKYLIILSGWAVDKVVWKPFMDFLSKDYEIIIVNWDNMQSLDEFKQKIIHLINKKDMDQFSVIGWSLGGLVAIDIAKNFSSKIENMILFNTTSKFIQDEGYPFGWHKKILEGMIDKLKKNPQKTLNAFYQNLFTDEERKDGYTKKFFERINILNKKINKQSLELGLEYLKQKDNREVIKDINIPILLIHGDEDFICPVEAVDYMHKNLKESKLIILNKTGHIPFFTKASTCYQIIKDYSKEGRK
ncbi:alpha/beta fold hydrolase [Crassaminicella thermophila]|uniref:Alpha/beta fold hydrolase n=1 Tax=Crassaminicella thermophila TaxID=2599308 RepID=A0A5C0SF75_CRATE|nr:alpha/beta fold hydrolase [Crassaminicella thermophila]QEK12810.1 alpha/beta fold hydrolase [Crassaminicella thermophila]